MFNLEKLEVWQKAIDFADLIYKETRSFPAEERFGLTHQLRRAAVSISSNIAEGSPRSSKTDFARFTEIAGGSVFEAVSQAFVARRQSFFNEEQFRTIYADAEQLSRMLSGLRKSLLSTLNPQP
jgi:four helix bundle protein